MRELSLELLALAHVSNVHDDPANVGAIEQVGARCLDLECSERRQQLELERRRRAVVLSPIEGAGYPRTVVVDHELDEHATAQLVGRALEDIRGRRARVVNSTRGIEYEDRVRRVLNERLKACVGSTAEETFRGLHAVDRERHRRGKCAEARDLLGVDAVAGVDDQAAVALTLPAQRKRDAPFPYDVRLRVSDCRAGGWAEQAPDRRLHNWSDLARPFAPRTDRRPPCASTAARSNAASCPCARSTRRRPTRNTAASDAVSGTTPFDGSTPAPTSAGTAHEATRSTTSRRASA